MVQGLHKTIGKLMHMWHEVKLFTLLNSFRSSVTIKTEVFIVIEDNVIGQYSVENILQVVALFVLYMDVRGVSQGDTSW